MQEKHTWTLQTDHIIPNIAPRNPRSTPVVGDALPESAGKGLGLTYFSLTCLRTSHATSSVNAMVASRLTEPTTNCGEVPSVKGSDINNGSMIVIPIPSNVLPRRGLMATCQPVSKDGTRLGAPL